MLVTGGASGIGKAAADLFTRNGATVVVADRTPGGGALTVDVSDLAAADHMVADVLQRHGKIDVLVHGPAILSARELSADGIYVNCVDPGSTETPLMRQANAGNAVSGRPTGTPEEVAETIYFVATNNARITGQVVSLRQR